MEPAILYMQYNTTIRGLYYKTNGMKPNFSIRFSRQMLPFQNLVIEYRIPITLNASQFDDYHFV